MTDALGVRFSINDENYKITGIELKGNTKPARAVLKRLCDENPNVFQSTDKGFCQYVTVRFYGMEYKHEDTD